MMRSPAIQSVTCKATLSSTGQFPMAGMKLPAGATDPFLHTNERQRFCQALAAAEEEARAIRGAWSAVKSKASQPSQGLAVRRSHPSQVDLMLTDLLMPGGMDGRQLAAEAIRSRPGMRALLMSGTPRMHWSSMAWERALPFYKPFTLQQLASEIRDVLDGNLVFALAN